MKNINKFCLCLLVILIVFVCRVCSQSSEYTKSEHDDGKPYDFSYAVKDDVGNDFGHFAQSDGDVVRGEYRTLLPDGRVQTVKYQADWKNGYKAEVSYSGMANNEENMPKFSVAHAFGGGTVLQPVFDLTVRGKYTLETEITRARVGAGRQSCSEGSVGLDCNSESHIDETKPYDDS